MRALVFLLIVVFLMVCVVIGTSDIVIGTKDNRVTIESEK